MACWTPGGGGRSRSHESTSRPGSVTQVLGPGGRLTSARCGSGHPPVGGRRPPRGRIRKGSSSSDLHQVEFPSECQSTGSGEREARAFPKQPGQCARASGLQDGPQHHSFFPEPSFLRSCFPLERRPHTFLLGPCGAPHSIPEKRPGPGAQGQPGGAGGPWVELAQG